LINTGAHRTNAPDRQELTELVYRISHRFAQVAKVAGFSLHAGVAAEAWERPKLERLCRYITRPALSGKRLSVTLLGNIRYDVNGITNAAGAGMRKSGQLKTPYNDGATHVISEPHDFISKLAALAPKPRVNLTRFHCVFASNSRHRVDVMPTKRGKGSKHYESGGKTPQQRHRAIMRWAQRLKRVFNIDLSNFL
jgi:hypothetical protein